MTLISGARDDLDRTSYEQVRAPHHIAAAVAEIEQFAGPWRAFAAAPDRFSVHLVEDLDHAVAAVRAAGAGQVVVVDLARPELGLPVVRVVVPGLESMWDAPGYTPGRRAREVS